MVSDRVSSCFGNAEGNDGLATNEEWPFGTVWEVGGRLLVTTGQTPGWQDIRCPISGREVGRDIRISTLQRRGFPGGALSERWATSLTRAFRHFDLCPWEFSSTKGSFPEKCPPCCIERNSP
ncbi:UNVERIFIED_CONTAM: hypothetical protein PYX00_006395 [Menopon gallinae]|uniref:Uncharacterized protein n=1 Tax=Menopon gallinae TaxID=328185 RepID=A0AAW2HV80_9NEOP